MALLILFAAVMYSIYVLSVWPFLIGLAALFVYGVLGHLVLDVDDAVTALELKKRGKDRAPAVL